MRRLESRPPPELADGGSKQGGSVGAPEHVAAALSVSRVSKRFRHRGRWIEALHDMTLSVKAGEFVCLVGPSGCGKTTLLNILAGFTRIDEGKAEVDGRPITGPGLDRCVLFQQPTLFSWMTVLDNVLFGPKARRSADGAKKEEAARLLRQVGLEQFGGHYPHQLSGGMRYRAAFARALINHPPALLLDEPFAALDAITRASMQDFLLELWQERQMTVVFVTHDVEEAALLADRVCVMSARPARIIADVTNPLDRPRGYGITETPAFMDVRRHIRSLVQEAMA